MFKAAELPLGPRAAKQNLCSFRCESVGGQPDLVSWTAAISGCAAGSLWIDALQIVAQLPA